MQAITTTELDVVERETSRGRQVSLSFEVIAYAVLIALAVVLRLAELDTVPLSDREARQALAAWRIVYPESSGSEIIPESPLLFLLHSLSFSMLGTSEFSVRWMTALAGAALAASPLLFRDLFGRARTFMLVILVIFSPVLLVASRFDAPSVWSMLSAMLGLWALRRYFLMRTVSDALLAVAFFTSMALLTDPGGLVLSLILLLAGGATLAWTRIEDPDSNLFPELIVRLSSFPWQRALVTVILTTLAFSTAFGLYLPGLSSVSETLFTGLRGFVDNADTPFAFPLLVSLFYEPVTWFFGFASLIVMARRGAVTPLERFFIVWLAAALVFGLIYAGAGAEHALWITVPLIGLASSIVANLLARDQHLLYNIPRWAKPLLALGTVALLAIFTINFQMIARSLVNAPDGGLERVTIDPASGIWSLISLAFIVLIYFMAVGLWGQAAALRGMALGLLVFGLATSFGAGWNAAVPNATNAVELWHVQATGREIFLLRDLLLELARRESRGVPRIPIAVLAPDDGALAWILRDFTNARYIVDVGEARAQPIVLLPALPEPPDLGGSYVGQDFIINREWNPQTMFGLDFPAWWSQRRTRSPEIPASVMVLWLRQDIYDGVPFEPEPTG